MPFDPLTAGINLSNKLIDRFLPSKAANAKAKLELLALHQKGDLTELNAFVDIATAQMAINAKEAEHENLFVAGWRPGVGWTCVAAFAYAFFIQPFLIFFVTLCGADMTDLPALDFGVIMPVMLGMLGLGGTMSRTQEKIAGANKNR